MPSHKFPSKPQGPRATMSKRPLRPSARNPSHYQAPTLLRSQGQSTWGKEEIRGRAPIPPEHPLSGRGMHTNLPYTQTSPPAGMSEPAWRKTAQKGGDKLASCAFCFVFPPSLLSLLLHVAEIKPLRKFESKIN